MAIGKYNKGCLSKKQRLIVKYLGNHMMKKCAKGALLIFLFVLCMCMSSSGTLATVEAEKREGRAKEDLTPVYHSILSGVTGEFLAGHEVDEAFLCWFEAKYGESTLKSLAAYVLDGDMEPQLWYELTGNTIHVLWLSYCKDTGFQSYQLNNVYWQECADGKETVLRFTGDFNFADDWCTTEYMESQPGGLNDCFSEDLLTYMKEADILLMNNEFVYSDGGTKVPDKAYTFRAKPEKVKLLREFGADIVTLANNHVYDFGEEGLLDTISCLRQEGITYFGAGENIEEASKIVYYVANGRKIAFVSATEIERTIQYTKEASEDHAGVLKTLNPQRFLEVIAEADKNSDYVIAVVHWGTEGALKYDAMQYKLAESIVLAGADAIIGGHPHRLQGAGFIQGVPVAYSLGNFWFSTGTLYTTVAQITIGEDGSLTLSYLPCIQKDLKTTIITEEQDLEEYYQYLASISVKVGIDADGVIYDMAAEDYALKQVLYDSDTCETQVLGVRDLEGRVIDIVGNLK